MNLKTLVFSTTIAGTLLLGACNNMDDKKSEKAETKTEMKDEKKSYDNTKIEKEGMFKSENKEKVEGKAMIKDGKLMLTDYSSSKGPDLHVYLTKGNKIKEGKKIDAVKHDEATQTFDLDNIDAEQYDTVTIYCDKAHVIFGSAKLK
ncbi:DM13 domain-containing protein [Staphylococcus durrellii]|uniref:DM13 domain-containing protein n=1 Tax=Staphylococcus durrellii TaxID=2781773 RepID=UPI00189D4906|nr:DM13 domain-containing protein [Staphylococcus durrellii]MBF7016019.1 DM13 domain-containing protein [Staphylococcus durrellii]